MEEKNTASVEEGKGLAIVAYITIIGLIVALILNQEKKNPFTAFHVRQSLGIALLGVAISVVNVIPFLGLIISMFAFIVLFIMWLIGLLAALSGGTKPVFLLGKQFQEWFASI